jgi:flagellar basal-body rod protein FlgC
MDQPSFGGVLSSQLDPTRGSEGVEVAAVVSQSGAPLRRYAPGHPDADADGYVNFPDINPMTEMVDLMGANRSYQLNATAVQAEKYMLQASIDLLK